MGPFGRNVLIEKDHGQVASTKDGVTVAKTITLEDPIENMAATVIKQAAQKTVDQAGDGTTTSTLLAWSVADQALEATSKPSVNVTQVKRGIEEAVKDVVSELRASSVDITDEKQIKQIATLSANGDEEIGELVATAIDKVGRDGIVTVEESRSGETSLEVVEGLQFDRGYKSPYMVTDNNTMQAVLTDASILLFDGRISAVKDLLPILERISSDNKSLLIVAEDIDGEALSTLIVNKMRGILKVVAVKAPDFGERRKLILEDIAILTGGKVFDKEKGMKLDRFDFGWLGHAKTVTVTKEKTTIIDGSGVEEDITARVESLTSQIENAATPFEAEKLQERLSKFVGVDIVDGPNVDVVCRGHEYKREKLFDVAVSTECFEHDQYWKESFQNMYDLLKPGGVLLFTCGTEGRGPHGVPECRPEDSPGTNDYYGNRVAEDYINTFDLSNMFSEYNFEYDWHVNDLYFYGIKK